MDFSKYIPILMQFLIAVPQLIEVAEKAFSGTTGSGEAKKDLVTGIVNQGLNTYQSIATDKLAEDQVNAIKKSVDILVDSSVKIMNNADILMSHAPDHTK